MSLKKRITRQYRQNILQRTQRQVEKRKRRQPNTKDSPLRQWLLAADAVDHANRRILFFTLTTLLLLPVLWFTVPLLLTQLPFSTTATPTRGESQTPAGKTRSSTVIASALPSRHFSVQLQLEQGQPETELILDKIRQRPLSIQIKTINDNPGMLLLIDETPTTQRDAERLKNLYTQLFGVDGKIVQQ